MQERKLQHLGRQMRIAAGRAQASLELLLVAAAFFAFLALWAPLIGGIRARSDAALGLSYAELALSDLVGAGEEAQILGSGSSRELLLRMGSRAEVEFSGGNATITVGNSTLSRPARFSCGERLSLEQGQGCVLVENREGAIHFAVIPCTGRH